MQFLRSQLRLGFHANLTNIGDALNFLEESPNLLDLGFTVAVMELNEEELHSDSFGKIGKDSLLSKIARSVNLWRGASAYFLVRESPLLALSLDAHGVLVKCRTGAGLNRLREVLGPERFIGVELHTESDCALLGEQILSSDLNCIDFLAVKNAAIKSLLPTSLSNLPIVSFSELSATSLEDLPQGFADGILVPFERKTERRKAEQMHLALAKKLGPCRFSAGAAEEQLRFQFNSLSKSELEQFRIPSF